MTITLTNPLHLYRALLRETTYLFDQNARRWTKGQIQVAFQKRGTRENDSSKNAILSHDADNVPSSNERYQLKRGRKFLIFLQRANQGHQRQLRNLLQSTYGRKGRQKRLLTRLLMQDTSIIGRATAPAASDETARTAAGEDAHASTPTKFSKDWRPSEEFMSILHTQTQLSPYLSIRKQIRLKPTVDEKNKWGLPMPPSRVKNITKKWYAGLASCVMPPVPEHEWESLRDISTRRHEFKLIPRRPMAQRTSEIQGSEDADTVASAVVSGLPKPAGRKLFMSVRSPHKLTPRFLSRFYGRHILNHTSVAVPNPVAKGLISKWDSGRKDAPTAAIPKSQAQIAALFG